MPQRPPWPAATLATPLLALALQGCAAPMTASNANATYPPPGHFPPTMNRLVDGPFRFWRHSLGVYCFRTWGCSVQYGAETVWEEPSDERQRPLEERPPGMRNRMRGTQGSFRNFEGPLVANWRDDKKHPHRLELDLAKILADGLIRPNVPNDEIAPQYSVGAPSIVVEINDRTVRLYMRALIPLKKPRDPNNRLTDSVDDLVLVHEQTMPGASS